MAHLARPAFAPVLIPLAIASESSGLDVSSSRGGQASGMLRSDDVGQSLFIGRDPVMDRFLAWHAPSFCDGIPRPLPQNRPHKGAGAAPLRSTCRPSSSWLFQ